MNLWSIARRNLRIRVLSSGLTTISVALGAGLVAALWLMIAETEQRYRQSYAGYQAVIGPKEGSPLALVLNTVMNRGYAQGIVPMKVYRELHDGRLARRLGVNYAIPQARGDFYEGFPLVGTTDEWFTRFSRGKDESGAPVRLGMAEGEAWSFDHDAFVRFAEDKAREVEASLGGAPASEEDHDHDGDGVPDHGPGEHVDPIPAAWRKAVIGAEVARRLGLTVGGVIVPVHGTEDFEHLHDEAASEVVGVLAPTGTPIDSAIYVPISMFLSMDKHEAIHLSSPLVEDVSADDIRISAIVFDAKNHLAASHLRTEFQNRSDAQVAWPHVEIADLLRLVGNAADVLRIFAWLVVAVAAMGVCVALYNTMNERRREIAIMRALGARRAQILGIVVLEASAVSAIGAVLGVALCHGAAFLFRTVVLERTSVALDWAAFTWDEAWLIVGVTVVGGLAGVLPAIKGSTVEVADHLGPTT
ncbi:MAG: ABC transporter permease [Planctomycetota bacterium]|jgi:putative ABC transport system permease protein